MSNFKSLQKSRKIYIIAGEESGDFIGSSIVNSLKSEYNTKFDKIEILGIGGSLMKKAGIKSLFDIAQINLMGFLEIFPHIFRIKKLIHDTVNDVLAKKPDILITIDSPGFTFRVAKKIKELAPDIKLMHVVAPSVWAYKQGRAKKYAQIYDHMLTLFPFEPKYFSKLGLPSICIGHPVLEQSFLSSSKALRKEMGASDKVRVISVTPGSRKVEINRHMPIIRDVFDKLSRVYKIKVIFVQPNNTNMDLISSFLQNVNFVYSFSTERLKAFAVSDIVLAKSGTNTLEIAASSAPMIVGYKLNPITFFFLKVIIKVKYASLINIIPNKEIVPEYIQSDFNVENICSSLSSFLDDKKKCQKQVSEAQKVLKSIGLNSDKKPSNLAAKEILNVIR